MADDPHPIDELPPAPAIPRFGVKTLFLLVTVASVLCSAAYYTSGFSLLLLPALLVAMALLRNHWALVVMVLYAVVMALLIIPLWSVAFQESLANSSELVTQWPFWVWLDIILLCQAGLLVVPVAKTRRRPLKRHSLWWPLVTSGFLMGALAAGVIWSLAEFLLADKSLDTGLPLLSGLGVWLPTWVFWTVLFYFAGRKGEVGGEVRRQCRLLLAGSVLELLIAVPTHIVARSRDYCCAGVMTFLGITFGVAVMLVTFGPSILLLVAERLRHKRIAARK